MYLLEENTMTKKYSHLCLADVQTLTHEVFMAHRMENLKKLMQEYRQKKIDIYKLKSVQNFLLEHGAEKATQKWKRRLKFTIFSILLLYIFNYYNEELQSKRCILELPRLLRYAFRPPEKCNFCAEVKEVKRLRGLTSQEFEAKYAYSGTPVVIEDATANWTALNKFDYWYFKDVYNQSKRPQKILDCQFLPYKTGFRNIFEALSMPKERVELENGYEPWYFGWSNCYAETAEELRRHYGRPYFLPETSENSAVDWFFIGSAGLGAHLHIDNVRLVSWQAQLSGSKRWVLAPPPECYFQCQQVDVVVKRGDIIVLDTNKWYHQTFVQPGEVSLTIGAEFD